MLAAGQVDAITGFSFSSFINLKSMNVPVDDIVVMLMADYGVNLYGNTIIVNPKFAAEKPEAVKGFLRAFTKGMKDVLADPDGSIKYVKERDALVDETLEKKRMKLAIESAIATPEAKKEGIGAVTTPRLTEMVNQVSTAFEVKNPVKPEAIFNSTYMPSKADRMVFGK